MTANYQAKVKAEIRNKIYKRLDIIASTIIPITIASTIIILISTINTIISTIVLIATTIVKGKEKVINN